MDMGLQIISDLLTQFSKLNPQMSNIFYQMYFCSFLQDILYVLTNSFYSSGFSQQSMILMQMFQTVDKIDVKLFDSNTSNQEYIREYVMSLLGNAFPHLQPYI